MAGSVLALLACCSWGAGVYLGGLASRRWGAFRVLLFSVPLPLAILVCVVGGTLGGPALTPEMLYAMGAGGANLLCMVCFYRAVAIGKMAVVTPICGCTAILPTIVSIVRGEPLGALQVCGMVLAMVGIVLTSLQRGPVRGDVRIVAGVGFAVLSALLGGAWMVLIEGASTVDPYWATLFERATMALLLFVAAPLVFFSGRRGQGMPRRAVRHMGALVVIGLLGISGDLLFAVATTAGLFGIVSVIGSMYPLVVVICAATFLKERVAGYQAVGISSAMLGIALLSWM